jgi:arylsulfatase A-like enzyme
MSCYGHFRTTTPNLDEFASNGLLFKNAFSPAIWTVPSHATLFTGTYPSTHGALNLNRYLDSKYSTLSEVLSSVGYQTVAFSNNYFISIPGFGLSRGFEVVEGPQYPKSRIARAILKGTRRVSGTEDQGASNANLFIGNWVKRRSASDGPFFLFANLMEAHAPYIHVRKRHLDSFLTEEQRRRFPQIRQDRQKYLTRNMEISEEDFEILRGVYDAQLAYQDAKVQELLELLGRRNLLDNSLVVITSDHGDMIGEHGLMHHSYCLYEELIRVPLLMKLPGGGGEERDALVSLVDIFSTVLEVLEIEAPSLREQSQGISLVRDHQDEFRPFVFAECERPKNEFAETYPDFDFSVYDRQLLAIRSHQHKYIWTSDGRDELYDIQKDPCEQRNLIHEEKEKASKLREELLKWYGSLEKHVDGNGKSVDVDEKVRERLKTLGYF